MFKDTSQFVFGVEERNNAQLIHIGYDPQVLPLDVVKIGLNDQLGRIALSPLKSMPNFYDKDKTRIMELMLRFKDRLPFKITRKDLQDRVVMKRYLEQCSIISAGLKEKANEIKRELQQYGLSRCEWVVLEGLNQLSNRKGSNKIII